MFDDFQPLNQPLALGVILPSVNIEPRFYEQLEVPPSISNYDFLRRLCWKGVQDKGIDKLENAKDYYARIKRELETFEELGFTEYVLLNWEVHNFCLEKNIPKGYGRGSCSGSLVLFLVGVTDVDPIKYDLFFERFVSKSRARKIIGDDGTVYLDGSLLADVDSDISYDRRHEVIEFIEKRHKGRTAKILTLGTLSSKSAIRECGKIVEGLSEEDVNVISGNVPKLFNIPLEISKALEESEKLRSFEKQYPKLFKVAKKLEGLVKNSGVHASGIAIAHQNLDDVMPVQMTKDGDLVTGFEMNDVASLAVKFDILGLKTLTVVADCCQQLGLDMKDLNPESEEGYIPLKNLTAPQGLFQIETDATFRICKDVRPRNLAQLSAVVSLSRPGASAYASQYAKFVQTGEFQSLHPYLDDVFGETAGISCFQEQTLRALNKIGFPLEDCETCRKIIGKKLVDKMPEWEQKVRDKIKEKNLDPKIGDILWKVMSDSANYQFAQVHAVAYSMLTYATVFLKFNHPKEFFLSLLKMAKHEQDPMEQIDKISQELPLFNIKLLPPDLSKSKEDFSIEGDNLRFGLLAVKGVSEKTIQSLLDFRGNTFENKYQVFQSAKDCGLNIGIVCSLIQAGCLESFGKDRCKMVLEAQMYNCLSSTQRKYIDEMGEHHNYDIFAALKDAAQGKITNEKGKNVFSEKSIEKLREKHSQYKAIYDQNSQHEKFCNWYFERKLLGYSYSYTLRDVFDEPAHTFTSILQFQSLDDRTNVRIVGVVNEAKKAKSKKSGEKYLSMQISDESGHITALFMDNSREKKWSNWLTNGNVEPKEGSVVILVGNKFNELLMVDKMAIVEDRVYSKLSELK